MRGGSYLLLMVAAMACHASVVKMAFGEKIPPFCFPQTNSGIELEVIGAALAYRGHVLKPFYFPLQRVPVAFKAQHVDAAMTDLGEDLARFGGHYANPAMMYDNVLFTLKSRKLVIRTPVDLRGLSVISFQGAAKRYPKWLGAVQAESQYHEENDQCLQVLTLQRGHYDVVLSNRNIFRYFTLRLKREGKIALASVEEHEFVTLNPNDYRPVFRDPTVRDDFNAGLKHIKESGQFQAIYDKYVKV